MDIFEAGESLRAKRRVVNELFGEVEHEQPRIAALNAQLGELLSRLLLSEKAMSSIQILEQPIYKNARIWEINRRMFREVLTGGNIVRSEQQQVGSRPFARGWKIFDIHNTDYVEGPGSVASTYSKGLFLLEDGRVAETSGGYFDKFYDTSTGLPPSFIYPKIHRTIEYAYELRNAMRGPFSGPVSGFTELYQLQLAEFVADTM